MTIFDLGDFITTMVLLFVVLYFRARDSNNRSIGDVRRLLDNMRHNLESRFQNMADELEERSVEMQAQRDLNIEYLRRGAESYNKFLQSVKGLEAAQQRLEHLFQLVQHYEKELTDLEGQLGKVKGQTGEVHKLDAHLKEQRRWAGELQNHLLRKLNDHQAALQKNFDAHLANQKQLFGQSFTAEMGKLELRLQSLEQNLALQEESLARVVRLKQDWEQVEQSLQADTEQLRQSQHSLRETLQGVLAQNSQMESEIQTEQKQLQEAQQLWAQHYAEAEQKLRTNLDREIQGLQAKQQEILSKFEQQQQALIGEKADELLQKTMEQVHQHLQEFEQWCSAYFDKLVGLEADIQTDRQALREQFRDDMYGEIEQMHAAYREKAAELFGNWNTLSENYQRLQLDFQQIESRSREELGAQFELYEQGFADELRKKRAQLNEHLQRWDENLKAHLEKLAQQIEGAQQERWEHNCERWESYIEGERKNLKEQLRISKEQIQGRENAAKREIDDFMASLQTQAKAQQEGIAQQHRKTQAEIRKGLAGHNEKLEQSAQKFQQMEKSMQERNRKLEEQYEALANRIQTDVRQMASNFETIEQQQQYVLSREKLIERAEQLWRETREEIVQLRKQNSELNAYGEQIQHLKKEFEYVRNLGQEIGQKQRSLEQSEERAELMQQKLNDLAQTMEQTSSKWDAMYAHSDRIAKMEEYLQRIEEVYRERGKEFIALEEQAQNLEQAQAQILQHINDISEMQEKISSIQKMVIPLEKKARELSQMQAVMEQNAGNTQQLAKQISALQQLLDTAQQRTQEIERTRAWLATAEERVKKISENLDINIHLAEQVALQSNMQHFGDSGSTDSARIDDETRMMVLQLSEKGWDNATISKQLNISVSAVELVLETSSMI